MPSSQQATVLHYESPYPIYALDWSEPNLQRPRTSFRLATGSVVEDFRNRISIIGLVDDRCLLEDEIGPYANSATNGYSSPAPTAQDFTVLAEATHGYPASKIAWQPIKAYQLNGGLNERGEPRELLASTSDGLRIWEYVVQDTSAHGNYVGKAVTPVPGMGRLSQRVSLTGQTKGQANGQLAPLTSFAWNAIDPQRIVTSSIDTTCTVWNIITQTAVTQLIAHDREVYDVAWLPGSTDIFTSVGADGSLRAFDLRSLEHSTILYETPTGKARAAASARGSPSTRSGSAALLRIAFNPNDANYMATFHLDSADVQMLDMRSPGQPVAELRAHQGEVNAIGWGKSDSHLLSTSGTDGQLLVWDLSPSNLSSRNAGQSRSSRSERKGNKNIITDPILAYTVPGELCNLAWSPPMPAFSVMGAHVQGGDWIATVNGKSLRCLKV